MGIAAFLRFALTCIHFLAWPVIALGYPLFASIRAVETGSKYQMTKLIIYWILFSLFSLFEFSFAKIIEWIPLWSSVRLIAILWLVMAQFEGAFHVYIGLVRPALSSLQAVINSFHKLMEEKPHKKEEDFTDVVEKYIKENGSEALEKLITSKQEHRESKKCRIDTEVVEPEEEIAAATSKQLKEPDASRHDNEILESTEKNVASTELKQVVFGNTSWPSTAAVQLKSTVQHAQSVAAASVSKGTDAAVCAPKGTDAAAMTKDSIQPEASSENKHPQTPPPLTKVDAEWKCHLCKVTTTCEKVLNSHLLGRKHKAKCESLRKSKLKQSSEVGEGSQQKTRERVQFHVQKEAKPTTEDGGANKKSKRLCYVCNVKMNSDVDLAAHLKGKRHLSNISIN